MEPITNVPDQSQAFNSTKFAHSLKHGKTDIREKYNMSFLHK